METRYTHREDFTNGLSVTTTDKLTIKSASVGVRCHLEAGGLPVLSRQTLFFFM